jgi:hypothetical protein
MDVGPPIIPLRRDVFIFKTKTDESLGLTVRKLWLNGNVTRNRSLIWAAGGDLAPRGPFVEISAKDAKNAPNGVGFNSSKLLDAPNASVQSVFRPWRRGFVRVSPTRADRASFRKRGSGKKTTVGAIVRRRGCTGG